MEARSLLLDSRPAVRDFDALHRINHGNSLIRRRAPPTKQTGKFRGGFGVNGRRPEGAGRGAFYSAGETARRSFATDLKRISKRILGKLSFLGSVVEPSSARRMLIKNRTKFEGP